MKGFRSGLLCLALLCAAVAASTLAAEPPSGAEPAAATCSALEPALGEEAVLLAPSPPDCLIFFCSELSTCPCSAPFIVVGQACEDENGVLRNVGRCKVGAPPCRTTELSSCE